MSLALALPLAAGVSAGAQESSDWKAALDAARGRVVVLNFWASWCEPCVREMPMLARLSREYGPRGVEVIAASIDEPEDEKAAREFARKRSLPFTLGYGATTTDMLERKLGNAVPATLILDRDGTPRFRLVGEMKEGDLRARIESLLTGSPAGLPELVVPDGMTVEHFIADHEAAANKEEHRHVDSEGGSATPG